MNQQRCSKHVFSGASYDFAGHRCGNRATVFEDGKWWCKRHSPEGEKAAKEAREARYKANAEAIAAAYAESKKHTRMVENYPKLEEENRRLLASVKIAYTILADVRHDWRGRHTIEGQAALCAMRDAIASAEGRDAQQVQDEFTNARLVRELGERA